jgi:putative alpha-1,2-mannosidase
MGLIKLFKSKEYFINELTTFFEKSKDQPSNLLPNPYYWQGNEHDLHSVFYFNYLNKSELTQKYSRWLLENKYSTNSDGIPGITKNIIIRKWYIMNLIKKDDYGTLTAWYVFTSLSFYPITGIFFIDSRG